MEALKQEQYETRSRSHRELLEQMALEIAQIRPPVFQLDTLEVLNEYRGFRHVVHLFFHRKCRNSVGEMPVHRLKARVKLAASL